MSKQKKLLGKLFLSTLYLSAFTFGGGYVIVSLMKEKFVDQYHWLEEDEMLDLTAIAQSSPGAIAVNGAIAVGYKLAGIPGIFISALAAVLPPLVIISIISVFYEAFRENAIFAALLSGMQAGVGAVITSVVYDMGAGVVKKKDPIAMMMMGAAFILCYFAKVNVIYIILAAGLIGALRTYIATKGRQK